MRKGEIMGLRWERVDLADSGFNARITLYDTKNGEPRGVPLNQAAIATLSALEPDPAKRQGSVFKRKNGESWGQIRTAFEKAVERAGLMDFRFHDLRHTAASHLAMRGRPLKEIQEVLGHKSFSMTLVCAPEPDAPAHGGRILRWADALFDYPDQMTNKMANRCRIGAGSLLSD